MSEDGFHEIQLNGKQLIFLFMAAAVVAVVVFLSGVMVGRGVRVEKAAAALSDTASDSAALVAAATGGAVAPAAAGTPGASGAAAPPATPPPPVHDELSYYDRLEKPAAAVAEKTPEPTPPPAQTAPVPVAEPAKPAPEPAKTAQKPEPGLGTPGRIHGILGAGDCDARTVVIGGNRQAPGREGLQRVRARPGSRQPIDAVPGPRGPVQDPARG